MKGQQGGADMNYRLTRKTTVGAYYSYTHYQYNDNVSDSKSNGLWGDFFLCTDPEYTVANAHGSHAH